MLANGSCLPFIANAKAGRLARYAVRASHVGIGSQRQRLRQAAADVQAHRTAVVVTPRSDDVHGRNDLGSTSEK